MSKVVSQHLQVFDEPIVDDSTTEFEYIEYLPRDSNNMNKDGQHIIETIDSDQYLPPHKAVLEVRGRLVKQADGSDYNDDDAITLVNGGWSLFKSIQFQVNNQIVEDINLHLPQASTILNLVQFSDDYGRSTATNMLWYRDTASGSSSGNEFAPADEIIAAGDVADGANITGASFRTHFSIARNAQYNSGFRSRQLITTGDKDVCMFLPLSSVLGFCQDIDTVFVGVKHSLVLTRQDSANVIHKDAGVADGKFQIKHLSLWMPKVTPSLEVARQIEQKLVLGFMKSLYFEQCRIYRQQYGAAELTPTWRVTTNNSEQLPTHVFIAFAAATRDNNQEQNNQVFDHASVKRIQVRINSTQYPDRELETHFDIASRNYGRAYMMFQEAVQKYADTDSGSQVSAEDFASIYSIFHFDVSKHKEKLRTSSADVEVRWQLGGDFQVGGNNTPYHVYCLVMSERFLKLEALSGKMNIIV